MKITIEFDDGEEIYQDVLDYYLVVRNATPLMSSENKPMLSKEIVTRSYSRCSESANLRELAKELHQSHLEIQRLLIKDE